ncbi:MAG TPA: hypothetical protein VHG28_09690 [Longimicrobiaceae bacterium]|nr:hypothetical protein [Longimicrobiaceae bacterium]
MRSAFSRSGISVLRYFDDILAVTKPQFRELAVKRALIEEYMKQLGMSYLDGSATFYFFVRVSVGTESLDRTKRGIHAIHEMIQGARPGAGSSGTEFLRGISPAEPALSQVSH